MSISGSVKIPGAVALRVEFHPSCWTEQGYDMFYLLNAAGSVVTTRWGGGWGTACPEVPGQELRWRFTSDNIITGWGWYFTVHPVMPSTGGLQVFQNFVKINVF
jgi:E3 ubiquitin-protein ligase HERC2